MNIILFATDSSRKYREISKISCESKIMQLNRNLNTEFYAVIPVSCGKEYFKVFTKLGLFCYLQHGEKRGKNVAGHKSVKFKLIEWY